MSTGDFAPWSRNHILDTAGQLFGAHGIRAVSMQEIADACEMNFAELSAQFESKEVLLQMFVAQLQINLSASFREIRTVGNAIEAVFQSLPVTLKLIQEVQQEFLLELEADYPEIWRKMLTLRDGVVLDLILANLHRGRDEGIYRKGLDPVLVAVQRHQDLLDLHCRASKAQMDPEEELYNITVDYLSEVCSTVGKAILSEISIQQLA